MVIEIGANCDGLEPCWPVKDAMTEYVPGVSDVVVMAAFPLASVAADPRLREPVVNVTLPEGVLWPGPETEAEKVTPSPAIMVVGRDRKRGLTSIAVPDRQGVAAKGK